MVLLGYRDKLRFPSVSALNANRALHFDSPVWKSGAFTLDRQVVVVKRTADSVLRRLRQRVSASASPKWGVQGKKETSRQ